MPQTQPTDLIGQLPHGEGFRFVDRIVSLDPGVRGQGVWEVRADEPFCAAHFPGNPIVPGVILGEAMTQMAALVGLSHAESGGHGGGQLAQINLRLKRPVVPPAEIELHAAFIRSARGLTHFDTLARCNGKLVAKASLTIATVVQVSAV